uniref:Uncharacterized protein n=1 Tax=Megaselia scalaris TaxID=36166 RepID=T1GI52_MEGSC
MYFDNNTNQQKPDLKFRTVPNFKKQMDFNYKTFIYPSKSRLISTKLAASSVSEKRCNRFYLESTTFLSPSSSPSSFNIWNNSDGVLK